MTSLYFGTPWPAGVCDQGEQVAVPVGAECLYCSEPIVEGDRGSFVWVVRAVEEDKPSRGSRLVREPGSYESRKAERAPVHRECSLRNAMGGIGHLTDHSFWCVNRGDPDAGVSYRQSALRVWAWVEVGGGR